VVFGQASGWPASFNLTTLNGTNGFAIPGIVANGNLGQSVSTAGDINGDGLADLVLGAEGVSSSAGTAYVIFGQVGGWPASFNLATLNGANGFAVPGMAAGDFLGFSVSTAGDINGDGKADLALGGYGVSSNMGATYVVFGQMSGWPASFNLATLNGTNGFAVPGIAASGNLGISVNTAGDLNADGTADLVLGAFGNSSGAGEAYVLFGQAGGWPSSFNLATLNGTNGFAIPGIAGSGNLGVSVNTAGDLDADGTADLVLGAYSVSSNTGAAYVLLGRKIPSPLSLSLMSSLSSMAIPLTPTPISPPSSNPASFVLTPSTIAITIPLNLTTAFVPLTANIIAISNNTATVKLIASNGYAIVFTANLSSVPLFTNFPPLTVTNNFSISLGTGSLSTPPVFEGCTDHW